MLSNEEKKAIEYLKIEYEKLMKEDNILFPLYKSNAKRLIDIIEKQSKEIEEFQCKLLEEKETETMELKIEDKLQEIYKHIEIEVEYIDFRKYEINVKIKIGNLEYSKKIIYMWEAYYTFDENIRIICNQIDNFILNYIFRKEN